MHVIARMTSSLLTTTTYLGLAYIGPDVVLNESSPLAAKEALTISMNLTLQFEQGNLKSSCENFFHHYFSVAANESQKKLSI